MLYTKAELRGLGLSVRGTYQGPLTLDYSLDLLTSLSLTQKEGRFIFDRLVITRQDEGYNVVEILNPDNPDFEKYRNGNS